MDQAARIHTIRSLLLQFLVLHEFEQETPGLESQRTSSIMYTYLQRLTPSPSHFFLLLKHRLQLLRMGPRGFLGLKKGRLSEAMAS